MMLPSAFKISRTLTSVASNNFAMHRSRKQNRCFPLSQIVVLLASSLATYQAHAASEFVDFDSQNAVDGGQTQVAGISANGNVAVGYSSLGGGAGQSLRWVGGTPTGLGYLGAGNTSRANGVSADGNVVVGQANIVAGGNQQAFRWSGGTLTGLGFLGTGDYSYARAASSNGSVVVGASRNVPGGGFQAFKWSANTMTGLDFLNSGTASEAYGISADGTTAVGVSNTSSSVQYQAVKWDVASGSVTGLGFLSTGDKSQANAVSANGSVIVGKSNVAPTGGGGIHQATRWSGGSITGLGYLGTGNNSEALAVSGDGNVIVGKSSILPGNGNQRAFRWDASGGMIAVSTWLNTNSISIPTGFILSEARGVNQDGSIIAGNALDANGKAHGWLARVEATPTPTPTPTPTSTSTSTSTSSGFIPDINAFNGTILESGIRAGQSGLDLPNFAMFGAHHRTLRDDGLVRKENGTCAWATIDASRNRNTGTNMQLFEAGVCRDFGNTRIGVGIGQDNARQDWSLGGGVKFKGQHILAEAVHRFEPNKTAEDITSMAALEASLLGYFGSFNTELKRRYASGASVDESIGNPNAQSYAFRARLDWKDAVQVGAFSVSPYAIYAHTNTSMDSYAETGGAFAAKYDAASWTTNDIRLGAAAKLAVSTSTDLRIGVELVHRFEENTTAVSGKVNGLWDFSVPSEKIKQDWARLTIDLDHRLSDDAVLTLGGNVATKGGDASAGVTLGLRIRF